LPLTAFTAGHRRQFGIYQSAQSASAWAADSDVRRVYGKYFCRVGTARGREWLPHEDGSQGRITDCDPRYFAWPDLYRPGFRHAPLPRIAGNIGAKPCFRKFARYRQPICPGDACFSVDRFGAGYKEDCSFAGVVEAFCQTPMSVLDTSIATARKARAFPRPDLFLFIRVDSRLLKLDESRRGSDPAFQIT